VEQQLQKERKKITNKPISHPYDAFLLPFRTSPHHVYTLSSSIISDKKKRKREEERSSAKPDRTKPTELDRKKKKNKTRQHIMTPYFPYLESPRC